MTRQTRQTLMLVLAAGIWGMAFVAQSMGAQLGAFTFLAGRSWLGVAVLWPLTAVLDRIRRKNGEAYGWPKTKEEKTNLYRGGVIMGFWLFLAAATQQIAITIDPSTAKASFLTAMYVVLVPLAGALFGRRVGGRIWLCVALAVGGLYLLCMKNGFGRLQGSDWLLLLCAVWFAAQIMAIDKYSPLADGVRLSLVQFFTVSVLATVCMLAFEQPTLTAVRQNLWPMLYCGVFSSGVAYTLQIVGQKGLNPTVACLAMCLESVFGALGGWLVLNQTLSGREIGGCALIFAAVVLAQLPVEQLWKKPVATKE
ncbi:MAG: DMT family transporter [Faecalibacterium sp.]|nr:DMT family transporter [Faecalibacterium sp.]